MNNDLISREALKDEMSKVFFNDNEDMRRIVELIDNAPTVDIPDLSEYEGIANALNMASELLHKKRTQGKWGIHGECPFCSYIRKWKDDNFCGNCGADMRKEESNVNVM